ncbi:hypothetical protein [Paenibacillus brevis]|uniref:Uncharacterized protein n=1 Tax=Paenibacillus brevis TaxID=2841508 RepID=A0ABS6FTG1_9BACL|nr:hypothetical protein [Paenibacillus brevis]MBU5672703.1 hypothetical protein [Paenibacillus brevis]
MLDNGLKTEHWTPEQVAEHCKRIGADGPPPPRKQTDNTITASQKGHNGKYIKKWGTGR